MDGERDAGNRRDSSMKRPYSIIAEGREDSHNRKSNAQSSFPTPAMAGIDGNGSDFSSASVSDDVELERLSSDRGSTDHEGTGLTNQHIGRLGRRKRIHPVAGENIGATADVSEQRQITADRNVLKALMINALLISAWYAFSLSISIVSCANLCTRES